MLKRCDYLHRVFRYCPVCSAASFGPSQGQQKPVKRLLCGSCGFEYFINAAASVMAIIERADGVILLTRRMKDPASGTLDLPGGFVDPGEPAEAAVVREVQEECGLTVRPVGLADRTYCNEYSYGGVIYYTLDLVFFCEADSWEELHSGDQEETQTVLMPRSLIAGEFFGLPSVRQAITDYLGNTCR